MLTPNIETFIACESSYEEAQTVLFGAPYGIFGSSSESEIAIAPEPVPTSNTLTWSRSAK